MDQRTTPPPMVIDLAKKYTATVHTNRGDFVIAFVDPKIAPQTVNNFVYLSQNHYYDGLTFHRVVAGFVVQGGDPLGNGTGGPAYKLPDENNPSKWPRGTAGMASSAAGCERLAVLHHDRRRALPRDERRLQPLRPGDVGDERPRQDQGRRQDDLNRHHGLVRGTLLAAFALIALGASACGYADPYATSGQVANESPVPPTSPTPIARDRQLQRRGRDCLWSPIPDGLQYVDLKVGTGKLATGNLTLTVEYTGWLDDGTVFDSSRGTRAIHVPARPGQRDRRLG